MYQEILNHLPYKSSFRFVDYIHNLDENGVTGEYTLREDAFFYEDHFEGNPVTPGVIIIEIMAQIGLVVLGLYLLKQQAFDKDEVVFPLFTSSDVNFYKMVMPGEKVTVISEKVYFRFGKLKCTVQMLNSNGKPIAKGTFAGVIKKAGDMK
jgi:3-hydroxyacyl-[acyl-carrier-protein] dehydratase